MQYRVDPKTGNKLSILGFGCMRFPTKTGTIDLPRTMAMVHDAVEKGINYFDTAFIYPGSETALGKCLAGGWREKVFIADKLPIFLCRGGQDFEKNFAKQLERLQTDHIDYYLLHMIQDVAEWERLKGLGIEQWIADKKKSGQISQIGFSFHGNQENFSKLLDAYPWDFCQIQYNYVDENNQAGKAGLLKAASLGMPVVVMEPLLGGKLTTNLPPAGLAAFQKANPDRTSAAWGLRWVWNHPQVTLLLSGMSTEEQLAENLRLADEATPDMLTTEELTAYGQMVEAFRDTVKVKCTACRYCMPCPFGVDIPGCFAAYNTSFTAGKRRARHQYMQITGALAHDQHYASLCKNCGKCESHCPQSLPIRQHLKEVAREMEPFWFKSGMALARRFTIGRKKK